MNELQKISQAKQWLTEAKTLTEIKNIKDMGKAAVQFMKAKSMGKEAMNEANELIIEAGIRFSEMKKAGQERGEIKTQATAKSSSKKELDNLNVTKKESHINDTLAKDISITKKIQAEIIASGKIATENAVYTKIKKEKQLQDRKKVFTQELQNVVQPKIFHNNYSDYLNTIENESIDLLLTDPPFSTDIADIKTFAEDWLNIALLKIKNTGRALIFIGAYPVEIQAYLNVLLNQDKFIVDNPLIWSYKNTLGVTPNMKYNLNYQAILHLYSEKSCPLDTTITGEMFNVQEINAPDGRLGDRFFKWQKPNNLIKRLIKHTTKENDVILDCFAGSGTIPLIAEQMKRKQFSCDNDKNVLKIAEERGCNVIY